MPRKPEDLMPINLTRDGQTELLAALDSDPRFSLEPDPTGQLHLSKDQKKFIKCYDEFRSIPLAANMAGLTEEEGREFFFDPSCKAERIRINKVKNYRKFSKRLLTIDEVGGYLTSLLLDEDTSAGDALTQKDKLQITRQIIDLNKLKAEALQNPRIIENVDYSDVGIQDLSPEDLKNLINQTKQSKDDITAEKNRLIAEINADGNLDTVDIEYLWSCNVNELQQLLNDKNKEETNND